MILSDGQEIYYIGNDFDLETFAEIEDELYSISVKSISMAFCLRQLAWLPYLLQYVPFVGSNLEVLLIAAEKILSQQGRNQTISELISRLSQFYEALDEIKLVQCGTRTEDNAGNITIKIDRLPEDDVKRNAFLRELKNEIRSLSHTDCFILLPKNDKNSSKASSIFEDANITNESDLAETYLSIHIPKATKTISVNIETLKSMNNSTQEWLTGITTEWIEMTIDGTSLFALNLSLSKKAADLLSNKIKGTDLAILPLPSTGRYMLTCKPLSTEDEKNLKFNDLSQTDKMLLTNEKMFNDALKPITKDRNTFRTGDPVYKLCLETVKILFLGLADPEISEEDAAYSESLLHDVSSFMNVFDSSAYEKMICGFKEEVENDHSANVDSVRDSALNAISKIENFSNDNTAINEFELYRLLMRIKHMMDQFDLPEQFEEHFNEKAFQKCFQTFSMVVRTYDEKSCPASPKMFWNGSTVNELTSSKRFHPNEQVLGKLQKLKSIKIHPELHQFASYLKPRSKIQRRMK